MPKRGARMRSIVSVRITQSVLYAVKMTLVASNSITSQGERTMTTRYRYAAIVTANFPTTSETILNRLVQRRPFWSVWHTFSLGLRTCSFSSPERCSVLRASFSASLVQEVIPHDWSGGHRHATG